MHGCVPVTVVPDTYEGFMAKQGVEVEVHAPRTSSVTVVVNGVIDPNFGGETATEAMWMLNDHLTYRWFVYADTRRPALTHGSIVLWHKDASDPDKHYTGTTTLLECVVECDFPTMMLCLEAFATTHAQATGQF